MKKCLLIFFWIFGNILFIHCQEDSTKIILEAFKLKNNYSDFVQDRIDTSLNSLQISNPIFKKGASFSYTGNLASPYINDVFYKRNFTTDFYPLIPYRFYYSKPEDITYFYSNKPYTKIGYHSNTGGKDISEHNVNVLHTQNFGALNAGFKIHHLGGNGYYERQRTTNGNGTFFTHFDGIKYELFLNASISNFFIEQNGGVNDSSFVQGEFAAPNLLMAKTEMRYKSFQVTQKYKLGAKVDTVLNEKSAIAAFAHTISLEQSKRFFSDEFEDNTDRDFYDTTFYGNTFDTSYYRILTNQLRFEVYEAENSLLSVHGHVGLKIESIRQFSSTLDTSNTFVPKKNLNSSNLSLIWNLGQDKKHYYWNVNGQYYFTGYKIFDLYFNSEVTFRILDYELTGYYNFNNIEPDFFLKNYLSNHFNWDNNFNKMQINDLGAEFISKRHNFAAKVNNRLTTGLIYFDENALPSQASKVANVLSIEAEKTFYFWKFVLKGKGIYQQTNATNYLAVPEWIFYSSFYIDHTFNFKFTGGKLAFQLGTDYYFKNRYYAYKYNPVFEQFYLQNEKKIGGYPYVSPFLNIKIKKARFYIKYEHFNQLLINNKDYYSLVSYPRNPNNVMFGLLWQFYD